MPVERCANNLTRIEVKFKDGQLKSALNQCDFNKETVIVIEGVFMYLEKNQITDLLELIINIFPGHTLLCELYNEVFFRRYLKKMYNRFLELGSQFKLIEKSPSDIFTSRGYFAAKPISIMKRTVELKGFYIPLFALNTFLKSAKDGWNIHIFERKISDATP